MKAVLAIILALLFFIVCCSTENEPITNIEWKLKTLDQETIENLNLKKVPTIKFVKEENKLNGFAGCNNYFGSYEIKGMNIKFGSIGSTQMACPNLDLESKYLKLLDSVDNYRCNGNTLKLYSRENLILEFIK